MRNRTLYIKSVPKIQEWWPTNPKKPSPGVGQPFVAKKNIKTLEKAQELVKRRNAKEIFEAYYIDSDGVRHDIIKE